MPKLCLLGFYLVCFQRDNRVNISPSCHHGRFYHRGYSEFPVPVTYPIRDRSPASDAFQLLLLQKELNANAMSVHSARGGGLHGHLTLTVTNARYAVITNAVQPFVVPPAPPADPIIPAAATVAQISEAVRQHHEQLRVFQQYHDTDKALVRLIIAAGPDTYIQALADPELGYAQVTALALLTHLKDTYGTLTTADRDTNLSRMTAPWGPPLPIEALFTQLEHGQRLADLANEPIANSQLARMGQTLLLKTGLYPDGCREWRLLPDAQQTWPAFKAHFARQERDRQETSTSATAGYAGAAFALLAPTPSTPEPPQLSDSPPSANALYNLPTGADLTALLTELARLRLQQTPAPSPPPASHPLKTPPRGYCWTHGSTPNASHTSATCHHKAEGHVDAATWRHKQGGNPGAYVPASRRGRGPPT